MEEKQLKIYIPNISNRTIGGAWTFRNNITKGAKDKFEIVNDWKNCDIVLIAGVTITDRREIEEAKRAGKKIVLRVDNMPKDSRNRGTAFSRMRDFGKLADWIVFQSEWARDYVGWWLKNKVKARAMFRSIRIVDEGIGTNEKPLQAYARENGDNSIIYNGVDTDYFYRDEKPANRLDAYLVVQHNWDENKRIQEAFYDFFNRSRGNLLIKLNIVGRFSAEMVGHNFDFFNNENLAYYGIIKNPKEMGDIMRTCKYFYFPAFADAASNTLTEAVACGCIPLLLNKIGGSMEVIKNIYSIQEMANKYLEIFDKLTK